MNEGEEQGTIPQKNQHHYSKISHNYKIAQGDQPYINICHNIVKIHAPRSIPFLWGPSFEIFEGHEPKPKPIFQIRRSRRIVARAWRRPRRPRGRSRCRWLKLRKPRPGAAVTKRWMVALSDWGQKGRKVQGMSGKEGDKIDKTCDLKWWCLSHWGFHQKMVFIQNWSVKGMPKLPTDTSCPRIWTLFKH